jgi:hypothetical protein
MLPCLGALAGPAGFVSLACGAVHLQATLKLHQLLSTNERVCKEDAKQRGAHLDADADAKQRGAHLDADADEKQRGAQLDADADEKQRGAQLDADADEKQRGAHVDAGADEKQRGAHQSACRVWLGLVLHCSAIAIFFSTGHGAQFNKLRFNAAFVGFDDYSFVRSGASMAAETLSGVLLAAPAIAPVAIQQVGRARSPRALLSRSVSGWMLPWAASCASLMLFLLYARRHLMVWAIFAPRLAFEMGLLVAAAAAAMAHIVLVRDP